MGNLKILPDCLFLQRRNAELEILQAFPKHKSFQAKEILKSIADKDLKNIETGIDAKSILPNIIR